MIDNFMWFYGTHCGSGRQTGDVCRTHHHEERVVENGIEIESYDGEQCSHRREEGFIAPASDDAQQYERYLYDEHNAVGHARLNPDCPSCAEAMRAADARASLAESLLRLLLSTGNEADWEPWEPRFEASYAAAAEWIRKAAAETGSAQLQRIADTLQFAADYPPGSLGY